MCSKGRSAISSCSIGAISVGQKGETLADYWDYVGSIFDWDDGTGRTANMILDDGGDATMFALWGARVEAGEDLFEPSNAEEIEFQRALKAFVKARPGYLTEKLFDCLASACVPVYIGSPGWQQVVPADCCIDGDRFADPAQLVAYLETITAAQFEALQAAGRAFLEDPQTARFSHDHFCRVIVQTVMDDLPASDAGALRNPDG